MDISKYSPVLFVVCAALLLISIVISTRAFYAVNERQSEIKLTDVKVAYIPETQQVAFVDKRTNQITIILSSEVTTAVFSLKAMSIQQDYLASAKPEKRQESKTKANTPKLRNKQ